MKKYGALMVLLVSFTLLAFFLISQYRLSKKLVFVWEQGKEDFEQRKEGFILVKKSSGIPEIKKIVKADLSQDNQEEEYRLEKEGLRIFQGEQTIWESPTDWRVDDFVLSDSTGDGIINLNLSVWKPGNFGSSKPFWIEENDMSVKNHFFVFELEGETVKGIWQSSNLEAPNCEFQFGDVDGDGVNELVVIEGDYEDEFCQGKYVAIWQWQEWGFFNDWRSEKGRFDNLRIEEINGGKQIVVDGW